MDGILRILQEADLEPLIERNRALWYPRTDPALYRSYYLEYLRHPRIRDTFGVYGWIVGDQVVAGFKAYRYTLAGPAVGGPAPALGIGAVMTLPGHEGRGHATAMLRAGMDLFGRGDGLGGPAGAAFLFSEIAPGFYARLGFVPMETAAYRLDLSDTLPEPLAPASDAGAQIHRLDMEAFLGNGAGPGAGIRALYDADVSGRFLGIARNGSYWSRRRAVQDLYRRYLLPAGAHPDDKKLYLVWMRNGAVLAAGAAALQEGGVQVMELYGDPLGRRRILEAMAAWGRIRAAGWLISQVPDPAGQLNFLRHMAPRSTLMLAPLGPSVMISPSTTPEDHLLWQADHF